MTLSAAQIRSFVQRGFLAAGDLIHDATLRVETGAGSYDPTTRTYTSSVTSYDCRVLFDGADSKGITGNGGPIDLGENLLIYVADLGGVIIPTESHSIRIDGIDYAVQKPIDVSAGTGHLYSLLIRQN